LLVVLIVILIFIFALAFLSIFGRIICFMCKLSSSSVFSSFLLFLFLTLFAVSYLLLVVVGLFILFAIGMPPLFTTVL